MTEEEKAAEAEAEGQIAKIFLGLENKVPGYPTIFYVPGNHDTKQMFLGGAPKLSMKSVNMHEA